MHVRTRFKHSDPDLITEPPVYKPGNALYTEDELLAYLGEMRDRHADLCEALASSAESDAVGRDLLRVAAIAIRLQS